MPSVCGPAREYAARKQKPKKTPERSRELEAKEKLKEAAERLEHALARCYRVVSSPFIPEDLNDTIQEERVPQEQWKTIPQYMGDVNRGIKAYRFALQELRPSSNVQETINAFLQEKSRFNKTVRIYYTGIRHRSANDRHLEWVPPSELEKERRPVQEEPQKKEMPLVEPVEKPSPVVEERVEPVEPERMLEEVSIPYFDSPEFPKFVEELVEDIDGEMKENPNPEDTERFKKFNADFQQVVLTGEQNRETWKAKICELFNDIANPFKCGSWDKVVYKHLGNRRGWWKLQPASEGFSFVRRGEMPAEMPALEEETMRMEGVPIPRETEPKPQVEMKLPADVGLSPEKRKELLDLDEARVKLRRDLRNLQDIANNIWLVYVEPSNSEGDRGLKKAQTRLEQFLGIVNDKMQRFVELGGESEVADIANFWLEGSGKQYFGRLSLWYDEKKHEIKHGWDGEWPQPPTGKSSKDSDDPFAVE